MADVKISQLPVATTPVAGTEVLPIVQSSITAKVSIDNLTAGRAVSMTSVTVAAGAVGTPSITTAGDTNTGIYFPAADTMAFVEGGAEAARITAAGDLLVGTTSAGFSTSGRGLIEVNGTSESLIALKRNGSATAAGYIFQNATDMRIVQRENLPMSFYTNDNERARITTAGDLLVGTTSNTPSTPFAGTIVGGSFRTIYATGTVANVASATLFTITVDSAYLVTVQTQNASGLSVTALVRYVTGGNPAAVTILSVDSAAFTVTISGTAVRITNSAGGTVTYFANIVRIF